MQRRLDLRRTWFSALIVTLICVLVAFGLYRVFGRREIGGIQAPREVTPDNLVSAECTSDGVVYYNGSSVAKLDTNGTTKWSYMVGFNAGFTVSNGGVAAWEGKNLTILDEKSGKTTFSGAFESEIRSAKTGAVYTAVTIDSETSPTIVLMENSGRRVDSLTFKEQLVIDYGFFYDGTLFWVMTLDSSGTAPSCTVSVYRPGKRMVGNIADAEQVLYKPIFRETEILVCGDVNLKTFSYNGEERREERKLVYGYVAASVWPSLSSPTIAFVPNDQYASKQPLQDVRVIKNSKDIRMHMPFECLDIVARNNSVVGFSPTGQMMVGSLETGTVTAYSLGFNPQSVIGITDNGTAVLSANGNLYFVTMG